MATITLTIANGDLARVVDAIAKRFNYQAQIVEDGVPIPNPESKAAFARRMLETWIKTTVINVEKQTAINAVAEPTSPSVTAT